MLNKVTLIGNLGKDPEVRQLESGVYVAKFPMATNENYRDRNGEWQTKTEWHDIVCWRNLAERVEKNMSKGSLVYVEGKLTKRKWQDKDGNDRYTTEIVAQIIKYLDKRENTGRANDNFPSIEDEVYSEGKEQSTKGAQDYSAAEEEEDDDLPF